MDLFDIFGITEEELKDEKKASAKPKKKEKRYLNVYARTSGGRIEIIH